MGFPIAFVGLCSLAVITVVTAQEVCTAAIARPIDAEVEFAEYLGLLAVGWAAICALGCIKKRADEDILADLLLLVRRDTLTCTATEECLSYKGDPFCFNRANWTFHTADGTTGNFKTGEYTLPDGRVGNMYHGPYPSETALPSTAPPAAVSSTPVLSPSATPTDASVSVITSVVLVSSTGAGATATGTGSSVAPTSTPKSGGAATGSFGARAALEALVVAVLGLLVFGY